MILVKREHVSANDTVPVLTELQNLDRCYFIDRNKDKVNLGIDNKIGSYFSMSDRSCPKSLLEKIKDLCLDVPPYELEEIVINYYPVGSFIPPHTDREGYLAFGILILEDSDNRFIYQKDGESIEVQDEAGTFIFSDEMSLVHEVPLIVQERHSIVFLYM